MNFRIRFEDFPLSYRSEKTERHFIPTAKESQLFGSITMFSVGGSLWHRVASVGDTQRVGYARNFAP